MSFNRSKNWQALGRMKTGQMNRTEQAYSNYLETEKSLGTVTWFRFEGIKFRLADNTFYTPDFAVLNSRSELECHEVKGFWADDARVKIKVAAEMYPLKVVAVKRVRGGWEIEEF